MVERLQADGVDEVAAVQIAWASFPFIDSRRPRSREFRETVRRESWKFLRATKGVGYREAERQAKRKLWDWSSLARRCDERTYSTRYGYLADGRTINLDCDW